MAVSCGDSFLCVVWDFFYILRMTNDNCLYLELFLLYICSQDLKIVGEKLSKGPCLYIQKKNSNQDSKLWICSSARALLWPTVYIYESLKSKA